MNSIKIALVHPENRNEAAYSVECGAGDNLRHFNHHGQNFPSPCNNDMIAYVESGLIQISHLDADTLVGIMHMLDVRPGGDLDYSIMEYIDNNGSAGIPPCSTLAFMVAIEDWTVTNKFPRCPKAGDPAIDVTDLVISLIETTQTPDLIAAGYISIGKSEKDYLKALITTQPMRDPDYTVGLYQVAEGMKFDPSRPYQDGIDVVVVHEEQYQSVSIYCSPKSDFAFGGEVVGNIQFTGHAKACGSPRGIPFTLNAAHQVFEDIRLLAS